MKRGDKMATILLVLLAVSISMLVLNAYGAWRLFSHVPESRSLLDLIQRRPATPSPIEYKDFISIMLSGLSLMVTVLGIGLATIAIWGYGNLRDEARRTANDIATRTATDISMKVARDVADSVATRTVTEFMAPTDNGETARMVESLVGEDNNVGPS